MSKQAFATKLAPSSLVEGFIGRATRTCRSPRCLWFAVAMLVMLTMLAGLFVVRQLKHEVHQQLDRAQARRDARNLVVFTKALLTPLDRTGIQLQQSTANARTVVRYRDSYFAATSGGLIEITLTGYVVRHYTVLDGLPESDLTSLAQFGSELFIGTRNSGLLSFDGHRFTRYRWKNNGAGEITALMAASGRLLIGTFAGGLIEFDGTNFRELKAGDHAGRLSAIINITNEDARLYVGTFDDGMWMAEGDRWRHFTTRDGLPSNRITGVAEVEEHVFVVSDLGLVSCEVSELMQEPPASGSRFHLVAAVPMLSSLASNGADLVVSTDDGKMITLRRNADGGQRTAVGTTRLADVEWKQPHAISDCRLAYFDDAFWLFSSKGVWRAEGSSMRMQSGVFTARHRSTNRLEHLPFMPFGQRITEQGLSNNIISALALDGAGRLWVGTFRDGIDVLNAEGRKVAHLESDVVREINYLLFNPEAHSMLVATSQGAMQFDARLGASRSITAADGLLSNSVTHLAQLAPPPTLERKASAPLQIPIGHTTAKGSLGSPLPSSSNAALLFATSRGFSFADRGRVRGLTTVQGLPSNNTYAVLARGSSVFVGTLGGLAQVEGGKVARVWTTSNSNLPHNWVNGLCLAGSRLFVGTYGGGVCELQASGDLHCFASEVGRTFVNPNAMWADDERLYVGTLDGAFVYELRSGLWRRLHEQLPAATVLAITGDEHYTYFGTTNGIARIDRDSWRRIPLTKR